MKIHSPSLVRRFFCLFLSIFLFPLSGYASEYAVAPPGGEDRYFTVTAYYSPLPGQQRYIRGNYEADIRLNGRGTNGADGIPVYSGMLAAPKTYSFGTKIFLPGLGVGTVHDRGGAIVPAGQRGYAHDRIDIWMGHGDEGLVRALTWGKRTVQGALYSSSSPVQENLSFYGIWPQGKIFTSNPSSLSLEKGKSGTAVSSLQKSLADLGYYHGPATGYFGAKTEEALLSFQKSRGIISSSADAGSGVYGPKTRLALASALEKKYQGQQEKTVHFARILPMGLSVGSSGVHVSHLQTTLSAFGYDISEEAFGEETETAVREFQVKYGVIASEAERGAGVFGPKTQKKVFSLLAERQEVLQGNTFQKILAQDFSATQKKEPSDQQSPFQEKEIVPAPSMITKNYPEAETLLGTAVAASSPEHTVLSITFGTKSK